MQKPRLASYCRLNAPMAAADVAIASTAPWLAQSWLYGGRSREDAPLSRS